MDSNTACPKVCFREEDVNMFGVGGGGYSNKIIWIDKDLKEAKGVSISGLLRDFNILMFFRNMKKRNLT